MCRLKCPVRIFKSRLPVTGTGKWNQVMIVCTQHSLIAKWDFSSDENHLGLLYVTCCNLNFIIHLTNFWEWEVGEGVDMFVFGGATNIWDGVYVPLCSKWFLKRAQLWQEVTTRFLLQRFPFDRFIVSLFISDFSNNKSILFQISSTKSDWVRKSNLWVINLLPPPLYSLYQLLGP